MWFTRAFLTRGRGRETKLSKLGLSYGKKTTGHCQIVENDMIVVPCTLGNNQIYYMDAFFFPRALVLKTSLTFRVEQTYTYINNNELDLNLTDPCVRTKVSCWFRY